MDIDPRDTEDDFCLVLHKDKETFLSSKDSLFTVNISYCKFCNDLVNYYISGHNNSWYMVNFTELFYDNEWFLIMTSSIKVEKKSQHSKSLKV